MSSEPPSSLRWRLFLKATRTCTARKASDNVFDQRESTTRERGRLAPEGSRVELRVGAGRAGAAESHAHLAKW